MQNTCTPNKKSSYSYDDLLASGRGELFGNDGPQLPAPTMLMMDRIIEMNEEKGAFGKGYIEAELDITPNLPFFGCHFIGDPVMPGCLGLDAMWQLVGFYLGWIGGKGKGRALGVGEVKFTGQILPTAKKVIYRINMKRVINRKLVMGMADGEVEVDGKVYSQSKNLKTGLILFVLTQNGMPQKVTSFLDVERHSATRARLAFCFACYASERGLLDSVNNCQ